MDFALSRENRARVATRDPEWPMRMRARMQIEEVYTDYIYIYIYIIVYIYTHIYTTFSTFGKDIAYRERGGRKGRGGI